MGSPLSVVRGIHGGFHTLYEMLEEGGKAIVTLSHHDLGLFDDGLQQWRLSCHDNLPNVGFDNIGISLRQSVLCSASIDDSITGYHFPGG